MMARCGRRRFAFTLIEILVVVAIIALLVAILLPSLSRAREQARQAVCGSNNKQIGIAMRMFGEEHREYYPESYHWFGWPGYWRGSAYWDTFSSPEASPEMRSTPTGDKPQWEEGHILKYVGRQKKVFVCPSDTGERLPWNSGDRIENAPQPPGHGNYSVQKDLQRFAEESAAAAGRTVNIEYVGTVGKPPLWDSHGDGDPLKYVYFKEGHLMGSPSRVMMLLEQGGARRVRGPFNDVRAGWRYQDLTTPIQQRIQSDDLTDRHSKRGFLMFFDGHAEAILSESEFNGPDEVLTARQQEIAMRAATKAGYYFDRLYTRGGFTYVRTKTGVDGNDPRFK